MGTRQEIADHLARNGFVLVRQHRSWARMLSRMTAEQLVVRYLPGIYLAAADLANVKVRCAALMAWDPDAVITGKAAAQLSFWPGVKVDEIEVHSVRKKQAPKGIRLHRSRVPDREVAEIGGLRLAREGWVAVHLARGDGGAAIDEALRRSKGNLAQITTAMERFRRRHGNLTRRPVVRDSRSKPWSQGERRTHIALRDARIAGWLTNLWTPIGASGYYLDIAFEDLKVVIEFDGWATHSSREAFEVDRERQNDLVAAGWMVLRITWAMLDDPARFAEWVSNTLRQRRQLLRRGRFALAA